MVKNLEYGFIQCIFVETKENNMIPQLGLIVLDEVKKNVIKTNIYDKLNQLVEEISCNEFVEKCCDDIHTKTGMEFSNEEVKEEIGKIIVPLLLKVSDVGIELSKL